MRLVISNDIKVYQPNEEIVDWVNRNLLIDNPLYQRMKIMGKDDTIRIKHIPEKLRLFAYKNGVLMLPFGTLYSIWPMVKKCEIETIFNSNQRISIADQEPILKPFDYQEKAIQTMIKAKGGVLVSSCGSGKTFMGIEIVRRLGLKTLWLCHTGDLLRQARDDFKKQYPDVKIGLTTEGELEIGEDITISTIQTMINIDKHMYEKEFDVVICDECAHVTSSPTQMKMFGTILSNISARYKYGLTATPARSDGTIKAMYAYIGCNPAGLFEPTYKVPSEEVKTIRSLHQEFQINSGYNSYKMYELYDSSGMIKYNDLITELTQNVARTEKICDNIVSLQKDGRKQVILCSRVEHCEEITKKLNEKGIKAELCVGKTSAKKRSEILNNANNWDALVATYALLKEGVSIPTLDTLHMVTPIKDAATVVQCAGRIERYLPDKKTPIVYDYVDIDIPYCIKAYNSRRRSLKRRF